MDSINVQCLNHHNSQPSLHLCQFMNMKNHFRTGFWLNFIDF